MKDKEPITQTQIDKAFGILNDGHLGFKDEPVVEAADIVLTAREQGLLPNLPCCSEKIPGINVNVVFPDSVMLPTRRNGGQKIVIFRIGLAKQS